MRLRLSTVGLLVLALACSPESTKEPTPNPVPDAATGVTPSESEPAVTQATEGPLEAEPSVELKGRCVRRPTEGDELLANLQVVNTGNIGVKVRVIAVWPREGRARTSVYDAVEVDSGETAPLRLRLDIGPEEAASILARGGRCQVRRRVFGAFGLPSG